MEDKKLNVVYIGSSPFPNGSALTKRRRYMVDYMNAHNIQSHFLVTAIRTGKEHNPMEGEYGICSYYNLSQFAFAKSFCSYLRNGKKKLKEWYVSEEKNILLFQTFISWFEWPFYKYAEFLGYTIIFDQVETSLLQNNTGSLLFRLQVWVSEHISKKAYKKHPAFVISTALLQENKVKYPERKLCLLPNSTPIIRDKPKNFFNSPLLLLYSGTYTPKDGVGYLIDGVVEAYQSNVNCKLILLGKGNKKDMEVLDKIKGKSYIEYRGFVSDEELYEIMKQCDILCMTRINSRFANFGFPFKLSEYLATGNLLLATRVGDVTQYVQDKISALIVEPESSKEISETISFVAQNKAVALQIAQRGFEVAQNMFSVNLVGAKFESFLKSV